MKNEIYLQNKKIHIVWLTSEKSSTYITLIFVSFEKLLKKFSILTKYMDMQKRISLHFTCLWPKAKILLIGLPHIFWLNFSLQQTSVKKIYILAPSSNVQNYQSCLKFQAGMTSSTSHKVRFIERTKDTQHSAY